MATKTLPKLPPLVVLLLLVIVYLVARTRSGEEIIRVKMEVERLRAQKDSIESVAAQHGQAQQQLTRQRENTEAEAALLRNYVATLERQRSSNQLTVRNIRKTADLQQRLEESFPEIALARWGVTTLPYDAGDTLGIEYFLIPVWFTETFIIDHRNAASWRAQKDKLLTVDSLEQTVIALQDSITALEAQTALALRTGYNDAFGSCQNISQSYIAELRKPKFSVGSTLGLCLGTAGAGVIVGTLLGR